MIRNAGKDEAAIAAMGNAATLEGPPAPGATSAAPTTSNPSAPASAPSSGGGGTSTGPSESQLKQQLEALKSELQGAKAKHSELGCETMGSEECNTVNQKISSLQGQIIKKEQDIAALPSATSSNSSTKASPAATIFEEILATKSNLDKKRMEIVVVSYSISELETRADIAKTAAESKLRDDLIKEVTSLIEMRKEQLKILESEAGTLAEQFEEKIKEAKHDEDTGLKEAIFNYDASWKAYINKVAERISALNRGEGKTPPEPLQVPLTVETYKPENDPNTAVMVLYSLALASRDVVKQMLDAAAESAENQLDPDNLPTESTASPGGAAGATAAAPPAGTATPATSPPPTQPSPGSAVSCGILGGPGGAGGAAGGAAGNQAWDGAVGGTAFTASRSGYGGKIVDTSHICNGTAGYKTRVYNASKRPKVTMFVIHETASGIRASCGYVNGRVLNSNRKPGKKCNVMYWMARNGDVLKTQPEAIRATHANWSNNCSIGMEVVVPCFGYAKGREAKRAGAAKLSQAGMVVIAPWADPATGIVTEKEVSMWGGGYVMPSELQMRRTWELINSYISNPTELVQIPARFPAINESDGHYKYSRYPSKSTMHHYWWGADSGKSKPSCTQPNQQGIVAHQRWNHGDGCQIEYYCYARSKGFSSADAYKMAGLGCAIAGGNTIQGIGPPAGRKTCPLPNAQMQSVANSWWGDRPLNPCVTNVTISDVAVQDGVPPNTSAAAIDGAEVSIAQEDDVGFQCSNGTMVSDESQCPPAGETSSSSEPVSSSEPQNMSGGGTSDGQSSAEGDGSA